MADWNQDPSRNRSGPDGGSGDKPGPEGSGKGQGPNMRGPRGALGLLSVFAVIGAIIFMLSSVSFGGVQSPSWEQFRTMYVNGDIKEDSVVLTDGAIHAKRLHGNSPSEAGQEIVIHVADRDHEFYAKKLDELTGGKFKSEPTTLFTQILVNMILPFLLILAIALLLMRGLRSAAGGSGVLGSFGKSRHRVLVKEKTGVTFGDVAGIDEAKDEVEEIIQFLKNPKKFARLGGRIPRGVLLVGEPGCGKTLLAKAIAGEADVPFFSISGSDFVEMFVGVGASRVRDLFRQAKDAAPCIIFLDEIDAVGRRRGGGFTSGGHDEREQTLNAILVEMDGFATGDGVIVIAATNRADVLDPALTRPGRFDRQIVVPLPDVKGRMDILRVHAKKVKMGPDCDLERLARATPMFSGADLAAIINEAAIAATLRNKEFVEQEDLEEARDKVKFGRARKSRLREAEENRLAAYHEAGHAVLHVLLPQGDPLHKVTIISRAGMGGTTYSLPEKDRMGYGVKWLKATMRVMCGGRIAEQRATGDASSGASMDIAQVTNLAHMMIEQWGMSEKLGFVRYAGSDTREMYMAEKAYSDDTAHLIDEEVRRLVDEAFRDAERLLNENWDKVVAVAEALLKYETLDAQEVIRLMRGEPLGKPTVSELLAAEARKTREQGPSLPASKPEIPPGAMPNPA